MTDDYRAAQTVILGLQYSPIPEHWRPVVGYEGKYSVSDLGRVRSEPQTWAVRHRTHTQGGRILPQTPGGRLGKYRRVHLHANGSHRCLYVHALVLGAFVGPRPEGAEILHGEGGPGDNRWVNLAYGSREENLDDEAVKLWLRNNPHAEPSPF
jgi:hypothetical protein